jgi:3-hydroxyisobutyrate dehydrogenase
MTPGGGRPDDLRVAVLGTGTLGSAVSRNLLAAGLRTTVWDLSPSATAPLTDAGATVAASPAEAAGNARVVITMLPTEGAVKSVVFDGGVAVAFVPGAVWAQMSTIGGAATAEIARRLGRLRPDVLFVDAPVSGIERLAETGQLLILASGPPAAEPVVGPAFSAICRRTVWRAKPARSA